MSQYDCYPVVHSSLTVFLFLLQIYNVENGLLLVSCNQNCHAVKMTTQICILAPNKFGHRE